MDIEQRGYFILSPPMLQTLASQEVALILCRHIARNEIEIDPIDGWTNFASTCNSLAPKITGIPSTVEKMIESHFYHPVALSFENWCMYYFRYAFYDQSHQDFYNVVLNCMDEFVLNPDGDICHLQTAKNIVNSDKLNEMEKYKFACINCLVDDIERLWPIVSNNSELTDGLLLEKCPLIGYWTDVMKGTFERLSVDNSDLISNKWGMRILKGSKCTAIEYFWNFLSDNGRIAVAEILLSEDDDEDDPDGSDHEERGVADQFYHLFLSLSDEHLRVLLDRFHVEDVFLYPLSSRGPLYLESEWMSATWNRLKHLLLPKEFASVVRGFIKNGFVLSVGCQTSFIDSLLLQMWSSAPANFKNHILRDMKIIEGIFQALKPFLIRPDLFHDSFYEMKFLIVLLSEISFQQRNILWREFWCLVIFHADLESLQGMMSLCLRDEDEITRFKENNMMKLSNIYDFCQVLVASGRLLELAEYLDFCSSNKQRVADLKRKILQSKSTLSDIIKHVDYWSAQRVTYLNDFVRDAFSNQKDANEYIEKIVESSKTLAMA